MRFKLDENLPPEGAALLRETGHDALTVLDQHMGGEADPRVAEVCRGEGRGLITLDLDFSNIRNYPPEQYPGIVVLRPRRQSKPRILEMLKSLVRAFEEIPLARHLWIVHPDKLRIRAGAEKD